MKLTIEIDCDNSAFENGELTNEIRRIVGGALMDLNRDLEDKTLSETFILFDSNGNDVGTLTYE